MLMTIWKYVIFEGLLELPEDSEILKLEKQDNRPTVWVLVNENNKLQKRKIIILDTGSRVDTNKFDYVGTFTRGNLVHHAFIEKI